MPHSWTQWLCFFCVSLAWSTPTPVTAQGNDPVYQWSVKEGKGRAFLWIPETCVRVRAVIVGQHNMTEEGLFANPTLRREFEQQGIAEVWIAPPVDGVFDFNAGAGERFENILRRLAEASGYDEVAFAPVIPIGHSACASYPWNFAAWKPSRTLAAISLHGDAPLTNLTGSGKPNPNWGERTIEGVPGLMMMAEYEWLEERLAPAIAYRHAHPRAPLAMLAEPGTGHFDVSDDAISFIALFIRKAMEARLPANHSETRAPELMAVDPEKGWLVQRWRKNERRTIPPAPAQKYTGDRAEAFWCFDEEMAQATQHFREDQIGKRPQLIGYVQNDKVVAQRATHQQVTLSSVPLDDEGTFRLSARFLEAVDGGSPNGPRWTGLPAGAALGHAEGGGPIVLSRITGPVEQLGPDQFRVRLNRTASTEDRRNDDVWLMASHPGDAQYKSARQQALLKLVRHEEGQAQTIRFSSIGAQKAGTKDIHLRATSDANLPVSFYVREGPAVIEGDRLKFLPIPPRGKPPIKVTIVAWQWGRSQAPKVRTAALVEQSFLLAP